MCGALAHVRFASESGHVQCTGSCPLGANSGLCTWPVLQGPATIAKVASTALLSSKAVEQPVPAGAAEVALAATTIGPARGMR